MNEKEKSDRKKARQTSKIKPPVLKDFIRIEKIIRADAFPSVALTIIEFLETELESNEISEIEKSVYTLFKSLLIAFWWEVYCIEALLFDWEESHASIPLIAQYSLGVEIHYSEMEAGLDDDKISDLIYEALPFTNAGIMLGSFSEYRAFTLAARIITILHNGAYLKTKKEIFKNNTFEEIEWRDLDLIKWGKELRKEYLKELPLIQTWPKTQLFAECESITYKIGAELSEIVSRIGKKPYTKRMSIEVATTLTGFEFLPGQVLYNGRDLNITGLKRNIFETLYNNFDRVVSRKTLLDQASKAVHYVGHLNRLFRAEHIPFYIHTITGEGYRLARS